MNRGGRTSLLAPHVCKTPSPRLKLVVFFFIDTFICGNEDRETPQEHSLKICKVGDLSCANDGESSGRPEFDLDLSVDLGFVLEL